MSVRDRQKQALQKQLERQIEENLRLRRRIEELNHELGTLRSDDVATPVSPEVQDRFRRASDTQHLLNLRSYLSYLLARLRATSAWGLGQRLLTMARRYRVLTTTLRVITTIITWVETSAFFLIYATIFLVTGVPLLIGSLVMLVVGIFQHHRCNEELAATLAGRQIYVCVAAREGLTEEDSYFRGMVRNLAARENSAVIVVSPFFWKTHGIGERHSYVTLRHESRNIYLIRQHYYFSLRRHVLRPNSENVTILF